MSNAEKQFSISHRTFVAFNEGQPWCHNMKKRYINKISSRPLSNDTTFNDENELVIFYL